MSHDESYDYFICAHCGAEVPVDAHVCRECGASDDAGWECQGDAGDDEVDDDFDYDEYIRREFPEHADVAPRINPGYAFKIGIVGSLILAMIWLMFGWTCR